MAVTKTANRVTPYVEELFQNSDARENLREGASNLRSAYERSQKRRVKAARDERLRRQLRAGALSLAAAGKAVQSGQKGGRKRRGRRLLALVALVVGAGAVALGTSEDLRESLFGSDSPAPAA